MNVRACADRAMTRRFSRVGDRAASVTATRERRAARRARYASAATSFHSGVRRNRGGPRQLHRTAVVVGRRLFSYGSHAQSSSHAVGRDNNNNNNSNTRTKKRNKKDRKWPWERYMNRRGIVSRPLLSVYVHKYINMKCTLSRRSAFKFNAHSRNVDRDEYSRSLPTRRVFCCIFF